MLRMGIRNEFLVKPPLKPPALIFRLDTRLDVGDEREAVKSVAALRASVTRPQGIRGLIGTAR